MSHPHLDPLTVTVPPVDAPTVSGVPLRDASTVAPAADPFLDWMMGGAAPDEPATATAEEIAGYQILGELGRGGMGVVYKARQVGLNRTVALKMVLGTASSSAVIRFLAEAEAVAALKHPNVVEVYQFGEHDGRPFLVLEFCPGGDLTGKTKTGRTVPREAAAILAAVAEGVNAAHEQGIVHRDLKPHNVLLAADGKPKVTDFGLAKKGIGADLTGSEAVMGTPAYMSPEQAGGGTKFVGPESDVWALGVMLYELLAGARPFAGPSNMQFITQILGRQFPSLRSVFPDVPRDLELIVAKCLRQEPRERYANAGELAADLRNWLAGRAITARPMGSIEAAIKWARGNRWVAASLTTAAVAMVLGTAVSLWQAGEAQYQERQTEAKAEALAASEADAKAKAGALAISEAEAKKQAADLAKQLKESRRLLDLVRLREAQDAWDRCRVQLARDKLAEIALENRCVAWAILSRLASGGSFAIWHTTPVRSVSFSPDGRRIVTNSDDNTVRVWDAGTGQYLQESKGQTINADNTVLSPDGKLVVKKGDLDGLEVWDVATSKIVRSLQVDRRVDQLTRFVFSGEPPVAMFSPDGERIACGYVDGMIRVWDATAGKVLRELKGHAGRVTCLGFSPDGQKLLSGSEDGTAQVWDMTEIDGFQRYARFYGNIEDDSDNAWCIEFSPDGLRIASGWAFGTVQVWDVTTGQCLHVLKGHTLGVTQVAFSHDGQRLLTGSEDGTVRVWDCSTGQSKLELKQLGAPVRSVSFSPDGRWLATGAGSTPKVWDAVTGESVLDLKGHTDWVSSVRFSPDGKQIVTGSDDKTARVWETGTGRCLRELKGHTDKVTGIAFSPDSRWVAIGTRDGKVWVWDAAIGQEVAVLQGELGSIVNVSFSADNRRIAIVMKQFVGLTLQVWDTASWRSIFEHGVFGPLAAEIAISTDEKQIAAARGGSVVEVWDVTAGKNVVELRGHIGGMRVAGFSLDGTRLVTESTGGKTRVWNTTTGMEVNESVPPVTENRKVLPDGRLLIPHSDRVHIVDPRLSTDELARRRLWARPSPQRHAELAERFKAVPFVASVHRSLEQQARGRLAVEDLDFDKAQKHFLAAMLLKPKPHQWPEVAPPPRRAE